MQRAWTGRSAPPDARLRRWMRAAAGGLSDVTLRIVGAAEARRLNRTYRGQDHATNVLSFRYGTTRGDLVLCHPVLSREARAQGKTLAAHYAHLVVHGMLHLRGFGHARRREAERMERRERAILARLGVADPYAG